MKACVRCPLFRVDPEEMPRLEEIRANLGNQLQKAKDQGWLGEVSAIETTLAAAGQKLQAMRDLTTRGPRARAFTSACLTCAPPPDDTVPSRDAPDMHARRRG
jgi:hypothetical protein